MPCFLRLAFCSVSLLCMLSVGTAVEAEEIPFPVIVGLARAQGLLETGQFDQAAEWYREVVQEIPASGKAWYGLGSSRLASGDFDAAIEALERAVELCHDKQLPWNELGNAYYQQDDFRQAEACYGKSLAVRPDAIVFYNRGNARQSLGETRAAIEDYDAAIDLDDTDPDFFNDRGIAYWDLEDWHRAASDFSKACGMDATNEIMVLNYCRAIENLEAWEALTQSAEVLLKKAPENAQTHRMLALGRWKQGQVNGAKQAIDQAIRLNADEGEFYELRAEILERLGRHREAQADRSRAEQMSE